MNNFAKAAIAGTVISLAVVAQYKSTSSPKEIAFRAHAKAVELGITKSPIVALVDFTKPSTEKRMFIYNADTNTLIYSTYVTHGSGSGGKYATKFSNINNTHASSLGVYKTLTTYTGKHGYSLKIQGLDQGYNNNALSRYIVVHGADYIGNGKTGRSWGCFAVPTAVKTKVINYLLGGAIIVAYYPDSGWLKSCRFLK